MGIDGYHIYLLAEVARLYHRMGNGEYSTLLTVEYRRTVKSSMVRNICQRERQNLSTSFQLVHFWDGTANPFLSSQLICHATIKWKKSQNRFSIIRQYLSRYIFNTEGRIGFLPIQVRTTSGDGKYICRTLNTHVALNCPFLYPPHSPKCSTHAFSIPFFAQRHLEKWVVARSIYILEGIPKLQKYKTHFLLLASLTSNRGNV